MAKAYYFNPRVKNRSTGWFLQIYAAPSASWPSGTYTNRYNSNGLDLFADTFAVNDCMYFGMQVSTGSVQDGRKWASLWLNGSGGGGLNLAATAVTGVWEYYTGNGTTNTWSTLTVTDNSNGFTTVTGGEVEVSWTPPDDWDWFNLQTVMGANAPSISGFFVRYRITAVTTPTEGGHLTTHVHFGTWTLNWTGDTAGADDVTMDNLYQWAEVSGPSAPLGIIVPLDPTKTTGNRAYKINCHLAPGLQTLDYENNGTAITAKAGYFTDKTVGLYFNNYYFFTSSHTSSISTFGVAETTDEYGAQGVDFNYNVIRTTRMDHSYKGLVYMYDCDVQVLLNGATYPPGAALSMYYSSSSDASKYINAKFYGLNFLDLLSSTSGVKKHIYFFDCFQPQLGGGGTLNDIVTTKGTYLLGFFTSAVDLTITNLVGSSQTSSLFNTPLYRNIADFINPSIPTATNAGTTRISWGTDSDGKIRIRFTVDVTVKDTDGTAISGATVAFAPDVTAPITTSEESNNFSVSTAADGTITQQTLTAQMYQCLNTTLSSAYTHGDTVINLTDATGWPTSGTRRCYFPSVSTTKSYTGVSGNQLTGVTALTGSGSAANGASAYCVNNLITTIRDYSPFTLTVSKTGYQTLTLRKVTVDGATYGLKGIKLAIELLPLASGGGNLNLDPIIQV